MTLEVHISEFVGIADYFGEIMRVVRRSLNWHAQDNEPVISQEVQAEPDNKSPPGNINNGFSSGTPGQSAVGVCI